jgi:hypothetical protein
MIEETLIALVLDCVMLFIQSLFWGVRSLAAGLLSCLAEVLSGFRLGDLRVCTILAAEPLVDYYCYSNILLFLTSSSVHGVHIHSSLCCILL